MKTYKIDSHIHLAGTGCQCSGCWISLKFQKRLTFRILKFLQNISNREMHTDIDQNWAERISQLITNSELDYGVVLGFDGVYHKENGAKDLENSQLIVPSEWVFQVCQKHHNLLPGPSINPYKEDALEELEYCIKHKAVLIKWLPSAQMINPSDILLKPFYELLKESQIPLLIHIGGEKTFASIQPEFNDINHLILPLEMGVKVICAHSGTKVLGSNERNYLPELKIMLKKYDNLWVDNSGICNPSRFKFLPFLAKDQEICARTLYGSDWPVPSNSFYYMGKIAFSKILKLERIKNTIQRDIEIKKQLGVNDKTLTTAYDQKVLANLDFWIKN